MMESNDETEETSAVVGEVASSSSSSSSSSNKKKNAMLLDDLFDAFDAPPAAAAPAAASAAAPASAASVAPQADRDEERNGARDELNGEKKNTTKTESSNSDGVIVIDEDEDEEMPSAKPVTDDSETGSKVAVEPPKARETAAVYATVMSKTPLSTQRGTNGIATAGGSTSASSSAHSASAAAHGDMMKTEEDREKEKAAAAAAENLDKTHAIATGTSHDKSVRSYSAYPPEKTNRNSSASSSSPSPAKRKAPIPFEDIPDPAKTYKFDLDPFQRQAVSYIHQEESVLVAAHTSAGKTAVAEYAIAQALRNKQRVIYTSPIKALSNQKFRDLQEEFQDVGLMTGDITLNPDATVLIVTTEILRSMLYRGSEIIREVAWVVYDEVHYMRDSERGVVWEESIILLPHSVRYVFLSATIPNASQFVDWICALHHQPCHVVYTNYRPVPLQHYIFPQGGDGLHLVVDERGKFREANFQKAMASLQTSNVDAASAAALASSGNAKGAGGGGSRKRKRPGPGGAGNKNGGGSGTPDLFRIVKLLMDRHLHPIIVFSFSKKDCERYALDLKREDYTPLGVEKDLISQVYNNAIDTLSDDDKKLPQVVALLPLLKRGIGIHHGGLLPLLKEIVEILFSEGLIKVLFATETFAIGINMPAKTVLFTNTRKWDGKDFRWVTSGEYIQMSGRAGRRGKDDRGIVIQMITEQMEPSVCKSILYGDPDSLHSSYKISYNMLLNMVRVEDVDPEYLLRASFHQFQRETDVPGLLQQAKEFEDQANAIDVFENITTEAAAQTDKVDKSLLMEWISQYYQLDQQMGVTRRKLAKLARQPQYILRFLQTPGRFLDIRLPGGGAKGDVDDTHYGWGALVNFKKNTQLGTETGGSAGRLAAITRNKQQQQQPTYSLEVLLFCVDRHFDNTSATSAVSASERKDDADHAQLLWRGSARHCRPVRTGDDQAIVSLRVFTVGLDSIERISAVRIFIPMETQSPESRKTVGFSIREVQRRFPDGIPLLDPIKDLGIKDESFHTQLGRAEELTTRMASHPLIANTKDYLGEADRTALIQAYERQLDLRQNAARIREEARSCETMAKKEELKRKKKVLRRLGHIDANGVIQTKGRTACEINTANELVVVELLFTGVFHDLTVEQCMALLSCLTFDERNKDAEDGEDPAKHLKSFLSNPFYKLQEVARGVAKAMIACKMEDVSEDEFIEKFNPGMMEAVFAWCKGAKFYQVQELTNTFEGTTIRTLRRLEELVRQVTNAAKAIGNTELQTKFETGSELLKRDIVFCSSLYL